MARTKQEVLDFLNSQVGLMVNKKCGEYNGQCVSLIKALLEFLGAPNPYAGRGNAKDVGDTLLRQSLARNGSGWLNVVVNRSMGNIGGVNYGHIWLDLSGEANFEQNGARALYTTKNTRPISQAQQIVNLDQYISEGSGTMIIQDAENWYGRCNKTMIQIRGRSLGRNEFANFVGREFLTFVEAVSDNPEADQATNWQTVGMTAVRDKWDQQIYGLQDALNALRSRPTAEELQAVRDQATNLTTQLEEAKKAGEDAQKRAAELEAAHIEAEKAGNAFTQWIGEQISKIFKKG